MNNDEEEYMEKMSVWQLVVMLIISIVAIPFVGFIMGAAIGGIIALIFPDLFLTGIGLLGISMTRVQIPLFCGILGIIGRLLTTRA